MFALKLKSEIYWSAEKVHTDDHVILYVKTLQLIFYANLLSSDRQSDESDWRKQATTTTNRHLGVNYFFKIFERFWFGRY